MGEGSPQAKLVGGVLDTNLTQTLEQLSARDGSQAGLRKVSPWQWGQPGWVPKGEGNTEEEEIPTSIVGQG